jgi:hypothetical protein
MPKIPELQENKNGWTDWVYPDMKNFREFCCGCGLSHDIQFRIDENGVSFRARQNARATAATRRKRKK